MMTSMFTLRSKFTACAAVLACAMVLSVAAYARGGGGGGFQGGGGGFHGGGGGFHGGGGGFHGGGGGFHGGGFHGGGFRGGGFHVGGGHFGGGRAFAARPHFAPHISHSFASRSFARPSFHGGRSFSQRSLALHNTPRSNAVGNARAAMGTTAAVGASALAARHVNVTQNANAVQRSLNARPINRALNNTVALRDARTRAFITASVATAAWHGGNWWWRHRNGGFGWVGPLFWPFAFYDIYDYAFWGYPYDDAFWGYGYPDLYAGIFGIYGYDDLMGYADYLPRYAGRRGGNLDTYAYAPPNNRTNLAQMCGDDSRVIAGLPIEAFQNAIQPNEAQRAALEELANASKKTAAGLRDACPTDVALTAPGRLAAMQQRIEAMIVAVQTVQGPLDEFYGLLSDEQKAQINALSTTRQRPAETAARAGSAGPACDVTQPELTKWPTATIEQSVRPTEQQRRYLDALQGAAAQAADTLKASCQTRPEDALTPSARLAAVGQRLNAMLQAVKTVRLAMDDFYGSLTDEQKAAFDAIGPQQAGGRRYVRGRA
jgi:LTXXQ motif family protein